MRLVLFGLSLLCMVLIAPEQGWTAASDSAQPPPRQAGHAARSAPRHSVARRRAPAGAGPVAPVPPGYAAAPVPNQDIRAPIQNQPEHTHVEPTIFELNTKYFGDGYPSGASPQGLDDRRAAKIPGIEVTTPLR